MNQLYALVGRVVYWVIWPGSWLYLRGTHRTRLLLVCGDELLVVRNWLSAGEWKLPGGGLNPHEDPAEGMVRELFEETGIRLEVGAVRLMSVEPFKLHGFRYTGHFFAASIAEKPLLKSNKYEIVDAAWLKRSQVSAETCGPDVLRALELYKKRTVRSLDTH